jgi:uncharacterized iron-regulated membrane protein
MAEKSGHDRSTDELIGEIASSRERVSRDLRALHYELDFPRKIRQSFREQTGSWITAAAAVGTLIVLLPVRKKKVYIDAKSGSKSRKKLLETGFALGALKIATSLVRPVIVELVKNRLLGVGGQSRRYRGQ